MVQTRGEDESERRLLADVERVGWHLIGVAGDAEGPGFVYSIGIHHTLKQPEIIIFGLKDPETMAQIINNIGHEMREGARPDDWQESDQILEGYSCIFRRVEREFYREYLGFARWFYQGDNFPILQCVWPDRNGNFPWQPDFPAELKPRQPILNRRLDWPFAAGKNRAVFTTRPVVEGGHPILLVTHDSDGGWQFLCGTTNRTEDARLVSLAHIVEGQPSLLELADLPAGWQATRESPSAPWRRTSND